MASKKLVNSASHVWSLEIMEQRAGPWKFPHSAAHKRYQAPGPTTSILGKSKSSFVQLVWPHKMSLIAAEEKFLENKSIGVCVHWIDRVFISGNQ